MKQSDHSKDSIFNPPAEVGVRLAYIVCVAGLAGGPVPLFVGAVLREPLPLLAGAIALVAAAVAREYLRQSDSFSRADESLETLALLKSPTLSTGGGHVAHVVSLLKQWDDIEHKRGSPEFDPWAAQAVRHDIRAAIRQDPALERLFRT